MPQTRSLNEADLDSRERLCREIIRAAGKIARAGFERSDRAFRMKGHQDFLTETDGAVEAFLRSQIASAFPEDAFLGEETGGVAGDNVWVVDPIDGTANFARGIPHYCISIAFAGPRAIELGAIYNPGTDELHFARRGAGATLNGRPIRVASTAGMDAASVELGWSPRRPNRAYADRLLRLLETGASVRRAGSGALGLAWVADGRSDGYAEIHMNSWDCLAGLLLVREAGGRVGPFPLGSALTDGGPVIAAAPGIAEALSEAVGLPLEG